MGMYFFDQYSLLHFAMGVVSYFWGVSLKHGLFINILYELIENTEYGMYVINTYFKMWPGGKPSADNLTNRIGDIVFYGIGWIIARELDNYWIN